MDLGTSRVSRKTLVDIYVNEMNFVQHQNSDTLYQRYVKDRHIPGEAEWRVEACWAHNPEIGRSKLLSANLSSHLSKSSKLFFFLMSMEALCFMSQGIFISDLPGTNILKFVQSPNMCLFLVQFRNINS